MQFNNPERLSTDDSCSANTTSHEAAQNMVLELVNARPPVSQSTAARIHEALAPSSVLDCNLPIDQTCLASIQDIRPTQMLPPPAEMRPTTLEEMRETINRWAEEMARSGRIPQPLRDWMDLPPGFGPSIEEVVRELNERLPQGLRLVPRPIQGGGQRYDLVGPSGVQDSHQPLWSGILSGITPGNRRSPPARTTD